MPQLLSGEQTFAVAISNDSAPTSFAEGVEFEETFPESAAPAAKPAPTAASSRPTVIGDNEAPRRVPPAPAPRRDTPVAVEQPRRESEPQRAPSASAAAAPAPKRDERGDAEFEARLERRLRNADALVKETIEHARTSEEKRLAEWVRARRDEEERRLAEWVAERRAELERTMEIDHRSDMSTLKGEIQQLLAEWQDSFEQRFRSELAAMVKSVAQRDAVARERRPDARAAITIAPSTRDVGRILRDVLADIAETSSFSLALHENNEVSYRYRVAAEDEIGAVLRRDTLDDGPESAAAHADDWVRGQRVVRVGGRNVTVYTAQYAVRDGDATIAVISVQSVEAALGDEALARFTEVVEHAAARLAELSAAGSYRT